MPTMYICKLGATFFIASNLGFILMVLALLLTQFVFAIYVLVFLDPKVKARINQ